MIRKGIYFRLKKGMQEEYIQAHQTIWPKMLEVLNEAGIRNYSIWNLDEKLFAYYELEDEDRTNQFLEESSIYEMWRQFMEKFIEIEESTGQKEWPMEMVFYNRGN